MKEYRCYCDASYDSGKHRAVCAFYAEEGGKIVHTQSASISIGAIDLAEEHALNMALEYAAKYTEPDCIVIIYSDYKTLTDALTKKKKHTDRYNWTLAKYRKIADGRNIHIRYTPRDLNKVADLLAKRMVLRETVIELSSIKVPQYYTDSKFNEAKFNKQLHMFKETDMLHRSIVVKWDYTLLQGYLPYLILKQLDFDSYCVGVVQHRGA